MKQRLLKALEITCCLILVAGCVTGKNDKKLMLQGNDLVFIGAPEKITDKVNVYESMARAAKYNVDTAAQNIFKKLHNNNQNPLDIAKEILETGQPENKIYNAMRALDFADIYAISTLSDNSKYIENMLYEKAAQNISLGAIKLHREEIFAAKQIAQIARLSRTEGKILASLASKQEKKGSLNPDEAYYKKGLEVGLRQLNELKSQLETVRSEYLQMIKATGKNLKLEGKQFYELDDFDKRYNQDIFQNSALSNRKEFALAKEMLGRFNPAKAKRQAFIDYPPVARLDINGVDSDDERMQEALYNKAKRVVYNLIAAVDKYKKNPLNKTLQQKVFDELAAAVMVQVELGYRIVEKTTFDYDSVEYNIKDIKNIIKSLERKSRLTNYEKVDLLNKRIELIAAQYKSMSCLSERAAAIRNLYYLSGLSVFDKTMLKGRIADIAATLKQALVKDTIVMLSAAKDNPIFDIYGNTWAKDENWLEVLISENKSNAYNKVPSNTKAQVLQLGAYTDETNAKADITKIKSAVPILSDHDFYIETAMIEGTKYYRLLVKPKHESLSYVCNKIIEAGLDCFAK